MKITWGDVIAAVLAIAGAVVMYAKLQSFSWWLIGSWAGAIGVIAVFGLGILLTNIVELVRLDDTVSFSELLVWLAAATVIIGSLLVTTTKAEFVWSASLVGVSWLAQLTRHLWRITHHHGAHYAPVH